MTLFKKCLVFVTGWMALVDFIFSLITIGQVISFLGSELRGFLHVTFYFGIIPIVAIVLLMTNVVLLLFTKSDKLVSLIFSAVLLIYLGILWKFPIAGAFGFFVSDYAEVSGIIRSLVLFATAGVWYFLMRKAAKH